MTAKRLIKKAAQPYVVGVLLLFVLMLFWLFLFPHGLGDNGDFYRVIHDRGLSHYSDNYAQNYFNYFNDKFRLNDYYVDNKVSFVSTQSIVILASIWLNRLFYSHTVYDIRFIGALYAAAFLWASWMILKLIDKSVLRLFRADRHKNVFRWVFAALYVLIFGDFGYLLYFNSFFGEALSYAALLLYLAFSLKIVLEKKVRVWDVVGYLTAAVLLVGAKQQNAPVGVVIALFTLGLIRLRTGRRWKLAAVGMAATVCAAAGVVYFSINNDIQYLNKYHSMTMGVMEYSDSPNVLKELDVNPQFEMLKGTNAFERYPMILPDSPMMYTGMYDRISAVKLGAYYLKNPGLLMKQMDTVADASYEIKPGMVGNFLPRQGKPPLAKTRFFSLWSVLKPHLFPHTAGFLLTFFVVFFSVMAYWYYRFRKDRNLRGQLLLEGTAMIGLFAALQFAVTFLGAGESDLAKHLFLFNACYDLIFLFAIYGTIYGLRMAVLSKKRA